MPLSCMLVFLQVLSSCDQPSVGTQDLAAANSPPDQVDFCTVIEDDGGQYSPLYKQAKTEQNGSTLDQLNAQMAALFADRNKRVIDSLQRHHMHAEEWATSITKIAHYAQDGGNVVEVALDAKCQVKTTIVIDLPETSPLAADLNNRKVGDPLVVTGNFIMHYTDTIPPVRALEWGVTKSQSMLTPEYHVEVTRFGLHPPTS